jgi:HSP20 family protein
MTSQQRVRVFALRQPYAAFELRGWRPALNVYETEAGVALVVELAGVDPDALHVHVHPNSVVIHGVRRLAAPEGLRRVHHMEIGAGPFELRAPLTAPIDPDASEARYANGLLEVWLPFAPEPAQRVVVVRIDGGAR